jgi:mRNA interferase HigB
MRIIKKKPLQEFWEVHPNSEASLRNWIQTTEKAVWNDIQDVRKDFPHADMVGNCKIFNIGGNNYRLITKINFLRKIVYIRSIMTHAEYDKNKWKADCSP